MIFFRLFYPKKLIFHNNVQLYHSTILQNFSKSNNCSLKASLINNRFHKSDIYQSVKPLGAVKNCRLEVFCSFHTSKPRFIHPAFWLIVRPIFKLAAVLTGRGFRKWWGELPAHKKTYFLKRIRGNKTKISIGLLSILVAAMVYYLLHLEETPITKRIRFMAFNPRQLEEINKFELETILKEFQIKILPSNHPAAKQVSSIVKRIVDANRDVKEFQGKKFEVSVIESSMENAFVLPIGQVFVFMGMINLCSNPDQLGIILSHEISHCILNHGAENVSYTHILDLISLVIIAAIWAIIPSDYISLLTHWLFQQSIKILLELPYNRKIETEADEVGLRLAAKACFDVRESSAFWSKMAFFNKTLGGQPGVEFLSTHPSHEARAEHLDGIMNEAMKFRLSCGCGELKRLDPRVHIEAISQALEMRKKYLENNPKPVRL